jgi:alginate O-acetyltransferase complex protein AlgI
MSFVDVEYVFFLPALFAVYWLLPRQRVWQNSVLLLAGWVFYASWNWKLLPLLLAGSVLDFLIGRYLGARTDAVARRGRVAALTLSLVWNLGALAWFKYVGFFADSFNQLMGHVGLGTSLPVLHVLLPLGISFYTLQRIAYIVDVYYGRLPASRSALDFLVFTCFFPQLTAGPIARGSELLPQFEKPRQLAAATLGSAAATFLLGYMLKAWIAESLAPQIVDPVFGAQSEYSVLAHWLALVGYGMQVFADFAGYSLLAIGTARFFGIELPVNFNNPFLSRSLPEFWRRWHITLNRWLFDYIYNPLVSGSGWFRGRFYAALILVFLASGLWHGAAMTFIVWGLMQGIGMVVHRGWDEYYRGLCRKDRKYVTLRKSVPYAGAAWLITNLYFLLSLIPFRAATLADAGRFTTGLVASSGSKFPEIFAVPAVNLVLAAGFIVLLHLVELPRFRAVRDIFFRFPAPLRGIAYGLVIVYLILFVPIGSGTFIYRQF